MFLDHKWTDFGNFFSAVKQTRKLGSDIICSETDLGTQLDITIKFNLTSYEFLTAIRCLNLLEKVTSKEVQAFSDLTSKLGADKMVIVSYTSFEKDATDFANSKNIELFETSEVIKIQGESLSTILGPNLSVYDIKFKLKCIDKWIELPEDKNLLEYLHKNLIIKYEYKSMNLGELIEGLNPTVLKAASKKEGVYLHNFRILTKIYFPHLREEYEVENISFKHKIISVEGLIGRSNFDPYISEKLFSRSLSDDQNHFDTVIEVGKFYYNPSLEFSYYCISVEESFFNIICVESYQHRELFQYSGRQSIEAQSSYVEITDENEINRLKKVGYKILSDHGITF